MRKECRIILRIIMNRFTTIGRITKEIEVKETKNGVKYAFFSVAVDKKPGKGKDNGTDFLPCVAYDKLAEFISKYFKKGDPILVEGHLSSQTKKKEEFNFSYVDVKVIVDKVEFLPINAPKQEYNDGNDNVDIEADDLFI